MKKITIGHPSRNIAGEINISGSKSESNRWLILKSLYPEIGEVKNLSNADDTKTLGKALSTKESVVDIHHAGTAMRFLTAYFALKNNQEVVLTGSKRMQERPIHPLVDALNTLGAKIEYTKKEGYPPIKVSKGKIDISEVEIPANISSQYITALMLIGGQLDNGLTVKFTTELTSRAYIEMTKKQLEELGIQVQWLENGIKIHPKKNVVSIRPTVESDWSSASYWFSIAALSNQCKLTLQYFKEDSLQGDSAIVEIYREYFGVETSYEENEIILQKTSDFIQQEKITLDLNNTPDIAQTIAITCAGLKIKARLTGLHTLKIKETDRLSALQNEFIKLGVKTEIGEDFIEITAFDSVEGIPTIDTYDDHRMAMSFAPISLLTEISINHPEVVSKSYPNFWNDLEKVGFTIVC